MRQLTNEQWLQLGTEVHGHSEALHWRFMCPRCGHVQSAFEVSQRIPMITPQEAFTWIMRDCEGTRAKGVGCDYALSNIGIRLHKLEVVSISGKLKAAMFEFADDPVASPPVQPEARAEC